MTTETETQKLPWYNNKKIFWWSLLIWPVFFYGFYKTNLLHKNAKLLLIGVIIILAAIGDKSPGISGTGRVQQHPWDKSVDCVEDYIKNNISDPDSYKSIKWGKVATNPDGTYEVIHTFEARNGFGGVIRTTKIFTIGEDGKTVIRVDG